MGEKIRVRVARSYFGYNGERYSKDDELDVHPGALEMHPNTLERVEDSNTDSTNGSEGYNRDELEDMEYSELSDLAQESNDESIHGRSSRDNIIDALAEG